LASIFTGTKRKYNFKSKGWDLLYGWSSVTLVPTGSVTETIAHMSEETKNAQKAAPRAMFFSAMFVGFMQLLCCICVGMVGGIQRFIQLVMQASYVFFIDQQAITPIRHKSTGFGIIDALFSHCPKPVAQFIAISIVLNSFLANVSQFFATSRFFWALARDKAIPLGKTWRKVTSDRRPLRATFLMIGISMLFSLVALDPTGNSITIFGVSSAHLVLVSSQNNV
jgi:amino acid transporter